MAVITVDPGGGGDHTTMAAAVAAATSGVDSIQLINNDLTESINLGKNIVEFFADNTSRVWNSNNNIAGTIQVTTGQDGLTTIRDFIMADGATRGPCVKWNAFTTGGKFHLLRMKIDWSTMISGGGSRQIFLLNATLPAVTDSLIFERCEFIGNSNAQDGINISTGPHGADSIRIQNCTFRDILDAGDGRAIRVQDATTDNVTNVYNNTFENCLVGIETVARGTFTNNLFINCVDDVDISGSASAADFTFCAFEEQGSPFGSNNIFGITSTDEVVDEVNHDFRLKAGSQSREAGTTITGVNDDFDGTSRPQETNLDIGAFEFIVAAPNNNILTAGAVQKMLVAGVIQKVKGT